MSDGELAGCVLLKEGTLFGECRPLLWPNNSPRRKEGGGSLDKEVCVCRVSFRRMLFFCTLLGGTFCCWGNALLVRRRWLENLPGTAHVIDRFVMPLRSCDADKKQGEPDWPGTLAPFRRPPQQRLGNALVWVALRATDSSIFFKTAATTPTVPEANVASQVLRWASAVKVSDLER